MVTMRDGGYKMSLKMLLIYGLLFGASAGSFLVANDWGDDGIYQGADGACDTRGLVAAEVLKDVEGAAFVFEPRDDKDLQPEVLCRKHYPIRNFRAPPHAAPEIDAGAGINALALLSCLMMLLYHRTRRVS